MRKIILNLAVSLDGFIEGPNGEYDWCIMEPEMEFDKFLESVGTVFFGRKSYELFGGQDPETFSSEEERALFRRIAQKEHVVFSNTNPATGEHAQLVSGDIVPQVQALKNRPGKDIWLFGGASLVTAFVNANLVDEYQLAVHPVILGAGKPLFSNIAQRMQLQLLKCAAYPSGVAGLFYHK